MNKVWRLVGASILMAFHVLSLAQGTSGTASSQLGKPSWVKESPQYETGKPGEWVRESGPKTEKVLTYGQLLEQEQLKQERERASAQAVLQQAAEKEQAKVQALRAEAAARQAEAARAAALQAATASQAHVQKASVLPSRSNDLNTLRSFYESIGRANLEVCNTSSNTIKAGIIRSNAAYLGLWGSPWIADGFYTIPRGGCQSFGFGIGKDLSRGAIGIFREGTGGRWHSISYADGEFNKASKANLESYLHPICWPEKSATDVDPTVDCPNEGRNVPFSLWFSTNGHVRGFKIAITDGGLETEIMQER